MDETQIRLIIIVVILAFGSTFVAFFKKIRNWIFKPSAPIFQMVFQFKDNSTLTLEDRVMIIPKQVLMGAKEAHDDIQQIPPIESNLISQLAADFYEEQKNKNFAKAAVQTYRAWHHGLMLKAMDPDDTYSKKDKKLIQPDDSPTGFNSFVLYTFLAVQNSERMPKVTAKLQKQYEEFFNNYPLDENEFILSWSLGCMLTNRNLIIFSTDEHPKIQKQVAVSDVLNVDIEQTGIEKLR